MKEVVLLADENFILIGTCLDALAARGLTWLNLAVYSKPTWRITARFSGIGDPLPETKATYERNVDRAIDFCEGFRDGYKVRGAS